MKIVTIPKEVKLDVQVKDSSGAVSTREKPYPFTRFLHEALDEYKPLGKGYEGGKLSKAVHEAVDEIKKQKKVSFENEHWKTINDALKVPFEVASKYNRFVTHYYEAIIDAKDEKKPKPKKGKNKGKDEETESGK